MKKYLLPKDGKFYKANLHCHTTMSDGEKTPEEIKEMYKDKGYSVVAFTDHDIFIPHPELCDDEFIALNGFEMQYNEGGIYPAEKDVPSSHFCFIAKSPDIDLHPNWSYNHAYIGNSKKHRDYVKFDPSGATDIRNRNPETVNDSIKKCVDANFFVTYNHPDWSLDNYETYTKYSGMHAMEIYNNDCAVIGYDAYVPGIYDDMLRSGKRIFAVAADDNHNIFPVDGPRNDSFGGFVMIKANDFKYESITDSLFTGDFYASQGPEIYDLYIEDNKICVHSSDAVVITLNTGRRSAKTMYADFGKSINYAEFEFSPEDVYLRITVKSKDNRFANTRAYFISEI